MKNSVRIVTILMVITIVLALNACMEQPEATPPEAEIKSVKLSEIGTYELEDYRVYGLWSLSFQRESLVERGIKSNRPTLEVTGEGSETFDIEVHKVDSERFICFIPERITRSAIEGALVHATGKRANRTGSLEIEKLIIRGEESMNGTNLYEMLLKDYIMLKKDGASRIYTGGELIRPGYVKTTEENAYSLKRYYDARQVSQGHTVESGLKFLKDRSVAAHNTLLFFGNPNRLSLSAGGVESIEVPDERERLRELGEEGADKVYDFTVAGDEVKFKIWAQKLTVEDYRDAESFHLEIKGLEDPCILRETGTDGVYDGTVSWELEAELARNARVTVKTDFAGGEGTPGDPYRVENWKHLNNVRKYMGEGVHFILTADLTSASDYYDSFAALTTENPEGWEPIGTGANPFIGTFSGFDGTASHTISDLYIDRGDENYVGLFGGVGTRELRVVITALTLEKVNIKGDYYVGAAVGGLFNGDLKDIRVSGSVSGSNVVGGLVGFINTGSITNAAATADVHGSESVGGFAGSTSEYSNINNAYATGTVKGETAVGGFVGTMGGKISNAYALGNVEGKEGIGGFIGNLFSPFARVKNAYSAGRVTLTVTGTDKVGGFVGENSSGGFESDGFTATFWDTETSGIEKGVGNGNADGVTGKTTDEMKWPETFTAAGWDFEDVWGIVDDDLTKSYPYLRSCPQQPGPGSSEKIFAGGDGTSLEPYRIASWKQLDNVRDYMGADVHFKLITDLSSQTAHYETYVATMTTEENAGWEPIGTQETPFLGTFSGYDGEATHTISDLCFERIKNYAGLFGYVGSETLEATVSDLFLENVNLRSIGYLGGFAGKNNGIIHDVSISGKIAGTAVVGGVAGANKGEIENVCAYVVILNVNDSTHSVGCIAGVNESVIRNATATGTITAHSHVGGVIGKNEAGGSITNTCVVVNIKGNRYSDRFGGFVGLNAGSIISVDATATVTGEGY
ncbi:MAG TPA: GLUG motif-containing protein [Thermotogota bacterium]|nr:GLUG motif-containing protein [Thermotogota bacterium]